MKELSRYYYVTTHYLLFSEEDKTNQQWESKEEGPFKTEGDAFKYIESEADSGTFQRAEIKEVIAPTTTMDKQVVDLVKTIMHAMANRPEYQEPKPKRLEEAPEAALITKKMEEALRRGEKPDLEKIQDEVLGKKKPQPTTPEIAKPGKIKFKL